MSGINVDLCDLCGKPYQIGCQYNGAEIRATIMQKQIKIYDEIYEMCLDCFTKTGLIEIFKEMKKQKSKNEKKLNNMSKKYLRDVTEKIGLQNYLPEDDEDEK